VRVPDTLPSKVYYHSSGFKNKILNDAIENNMVDIEASDIDLKRLYNQLTEMKGSMKALFSTSWV
jgi:hypothetical protein